MKQSLLILFLFLVSTGTMAQNLVPNCSFEDYSECPSAFHQLDRAKGWYRYTIKPPDPEDGGTPDYFNECYVLSSNGSGFNFDVPTNRYGNQAALHGKAYIGCYTYDNRQVVNYKEYAARIITPLKKGQTYEVSMSVSLADTSALGTDDLGIYFFLNGPDTVISNQVLPINPQVNFYKYGAITEKANWVRLQSIFVPDSAYDHIVIGGFKDTGTIGKAPLEPITPLSFAYYYIDSVVIKIFDGFTLNVKDTTFCPGNIVNIPYTLSSNNYFNSSNVFIVELSNANGQFNTPIFIGAATGNTSGVITCTIPASLPEGNGYKLRVMANNPNAIFYPDATISIYKLNPKVSGSTPVCEGETIQLLITEKLASTLFTWAGPDSFAAVTKTKDTSLLKATVAMSGKYILTASLGNCISRDSINVQVNPLPPVPELTNNGPLLAGQTLMLTIVNSAPGNSYLWQGPEGYTSYTQNPEIPYTIPRMSGKYLLTVTQHGCSSTGSTEVKIISEADIGKFILYPNPNNGNFTVEGFVKTDQKIALRVVNAVGQLIYKEQVQTVNRFLQHKISLPFVANGGYMLHLRADAKDHPIPFIIKH